MSNELIIPSAFTETSLTLPEGLSLEEWLATGEKLGRLQRASAWWVGDWLNYGERVYGETYAEGMETTGLEYQTVANCAWVAGEIEVSRRRESLSFSHHAEVAALDAEDQDFFLAEAEQHSWSRNDLRRAIRNRRALTPPFIPGTYATVVADPPWDIATGPVHATNAAARPLTYPTLSVEDIAALPVRDHLAENAHLYLWTINAYVADAYEIARSWGFEPSTLLVWCKTPNGLGLGGTFSISTEYVLFARRGTLEANERVDGTAFHWKRGRHSEKPDAFLELVERVSPGPYLEMFARRQRPGWTSWGDEVSVAA